MFRRVNDTKPYWAVHVEMNGENVLTIEPHMLAGAEITKEIEDCIRQAAHHLLSFIGDPSPTPEAK